MNTTPSYIELYNNGELKHRVNKASEILHCCNACPHECHADRLNGQRGICHSGAIPIVSSYTLHHGEEPLISGTRGAGNTFFGNCNLACIYCQNHEISQNWKEEEFHTVSIERLAGIMLELQEMGAHNIGWVSPTHFVPVILKSFYIAVEQGLNLPVIYNSNGYDSVEVLKLLEGIVDIYLPDIKYGCDNYGEKYSNAEKYFTSAKLAVKEMHRQVGTKLTVEKNTLLRGLIIRHLVLPNDLSESENVFKFIADELNPDVYISLMSQYYPAHRSAEEILLDRRLRESEYNRTLSLLKKYGLTKGWIQEMESFDHYRPDFIRNRKNPFNNQL